MGKFGVGQGGLEGRETPPKGVSLRLQGLSFFPFHLDFSARMWYNNTKERGDGNGERRNGGRGGADLERGEIPHLPTPRKESERTFVGVRRREGREGREPGGRAPARVPGRTGAEGRTDGSLRRGSARIPRYHRPADSLLRHSRGRAYPA